LLIGASNAIRAADPNAKIVFNTNSMPGDPSIATWFPPLISDSAVRNAVDIMSFHCYPRPAAPEIGNFVRNPVGPLDVRLDRTETILSANGWTGEVWITEGGWATNAPLADTIVSHADQARFLIRQAVILLERVNRYYMYTLYGGPDGVPVTDEGPGMGMLLDTLVPKISFGAWKYLSNKPIAGLVRVTETLPLWHYQHLTGHILWTTSGTVNKVITGLPSFVYKTDLFGTTTTVNTTNGSLTVAATIDPTYIDIPQQQQGIIKAKGFFFTTYANNGTIPFAARLDAYRIQIPVATHALLAVHIQVNGVNGNTCSRTAMSETPANLANWFAAVRARGLIPALAIIMFTDASFSWAGFWAPSNPTAALASYYTAIQPYVQAAEAAGCEFIHLADEWSAMFSRSAAVTGFTNLAAAARADYSGKILWNVSNIEESDILDPIVALSDMMGISAYVPIGITNSPTVQQMITNLTANSQVATVSNLVNDRRVQWNDPTVVGYMQYLKALSGRWNRPLVLTVGYKSTVGCSRDPSEQPETTPDQTAQANAWEAFLTSRSFAEPTVYGSFCWRWWPSTQDDDGATGFTPQDKTAAAVIARLL